MKRLLLVAAALLISASSQAGLTYQFKSTTEGGSRTGNGLAGKASVENGKMRLDLAEGDGLLFKDGAVVLSSDGGKNWTILDPKEKTYYQLALDQLMGSLGSILKGAGGMVKLSITNQDVKVADEGDSGVVAGYPTRKHVVNTSYDLAMSVFGMSNNVHVVTKTESWATDKLPIDAVTFVQMRGFKTGLPDLDKLIDAQGSAIHGFPLRQVMTTTSTAKNGKSTTSTTTVTISAIEKTTVPAAQFAVPPGYRETEASPFAGMVK